MYKIPTSTTPSVFSTHNLMPNVTSLLVMKNYEGKRNMKESIKLGIAVIGTGLIGGLCWKYRRKIINRIAEFVGTTAAIYTEYDYGEMPNYTWVKGHWRFDRYGNMTYVKPHYRVTYKRRRY